MHGGGGWCESVPGNPFCSLMPSYRLQLSSDSLAAMAARQRAIMGNYMLLIVKIERRSLCVCLFGVLCESSQTLHLTWILLVNFNVKNTWWYYNIIGFM